MSGKRNKLGLAVVAGALLCLAAYVSANDILDPAVQDSGGGRAESSSYRVQASVGGPALGTASSANYKVDVGAVSVVEAGREAGAPSGGGGGGCAAGGGVGTLAFCGMLACLMGATGKVKRGSRSRI